MTITLVELETSIQQKIDNDSDFQSSLADLTDDEKTVKVSERKQTEINAELEKLSKTAQNYEAQKIRAEKAEREARELREKAGSSPKTDPNKIELSPKDYLALTEQKVSSDDFDEVMNWATYRKLTVTEALKDKTLQTILREKAEERATEAATASKARRPASSEPQGQELLNNAARGQFNETDEGIAELVAAEHKAKLAKVKK